MIEGNFGYKSSDEEIQNFVPKITVLGVGGAGCNAVNNMIAQGMEGVDFVVANTDAQSLLQSKSLKKIQLGKKITSGKGAGADPEMGRAAAEESSGEIVDVIKNSSMLFLTGGMGGGTGSGALPVIASLAKERDILTVAIITMPFDFEGKNRKKIAQNALEQLIPNVDSYIVLPNQNLFNLVDEQITFYNAFKVSDNVLFDGVKNITDLIRIPGTINLDFADIRTVMKDSGRALMGTAVKSGEKRSLRAVEDIILNPLLQGSSIRGAKSVLVNITANRESLSLTEPAEVMNSIRTAIENDDTNLSLGTCFDDSMGDELKVAVIATGLSQAENTEFVPRASSGLGEKNLHNVEAEKKPVSFAGLNAEDEEPVALGGLGFDTEVAEENALSDTVGMETQDDVNVGVEESRGATTLHEEAESFAKEPYLSMAGNAENGGDNAKDSSFDSFIQNLDGPVDIDDFLNMEAENIKSKSSLGNEKKDGGDDDPDTPDGGGRKNKDLSSFFDMIDKDSKSDGFFDDLDIFKDKHDSKLSFDSDLQVRALQKEEKKEEDNVVFLAGGMDEQKKKSRQSDFEDMFSKMEETFELPTIFKKKI